MLYHASLFPVKEFIPRIPLVRCENEDETFPRISFSEEDEFHAISAIPFIRENISMMLELGLYPTLYLYTYPETACRIVHSIYEEAEGKRLLPSGDVQLYVPDAYLTKECWMLDSPDPSKMEMHLYEIEDILYDEIDKQEQLIHVSLTMLSEYPEDNFTKLFSAYGIRKSLDDTNFSEFYYPGIENAFLSNCLNIITEKELKK